MHRIWIFVVLFSSALAQSAPDAPPDFSAKDLTGQSHSLAEFKGKVVLLNFWATWCEPCQDEMPLIVKAQQTYGDKISVLTASLDDASTQKNIPKFVHKKKMEALPIWLTTVDDLKLLGVGPGLPATLFIDRDGRIISRVIGQLKKKDIPARIDWMLSDRTSPAPAALQDNMKD